MDFLKICRLCCEEKQQMRLILGNECASYPLKEIFRNVLQIEVSSDDQLPQKVCGECIEAMIKLNQTIETFCENDIRLRRQLYEDVTIKLEEGEEMDTDLLVDSMASAQMLSQLQPEPTPEPTADQATKHLLKKLGLERLMAQFERHAITHHDFGYFHENKFELREVLPVIRDRIDFVERTRNIKSVKVQSVAVQASFETVHTSQELLDICSKYSSGKKFLNLYINADGSKKFQPKYRDYIRDALVEHYITLGKGTIPGVHFSEMVAIVRKELPEEDPNTWYFPAYDGVTAGGVLYTRYRYVKKTDPRFKSQKASTTTSVSDITDENEKWESLSEEEKKACFAAKKQLRGVNLSHSENILIAWKKSFPLRRYEAVQGKLQFCDWDVIKRFGDVHLLVSYDFQKIHNINTDIFHQRLPKYVSQLKATFDGYKNFIKDEDSTLHEQLLNAFSGSLTVDETTVFASMYCLPLILKQSFVKRGNKRTKPTTLSSRDAFITKIASEAAITEMIAKRRNTAHEVYGTIQPFIIAIGSAIESLKYFVSFDDILWEAKTISSAIDLLFRSYAAFHVEYAKECESVLKFLQVYFYDINYKGQRIDTGVSSFISDLNRTVMVAQSTEQFLRANNLPQYVAAFNNQQLEMKHLSYLLHNHEDLKELIPTIRDRAEFTLAVQNNAKTANDSNEFIPSIRDRAAFTLAVQSSAKTANDKPAAKMINQKANAKTTIDKSGTKMTYYETSAQTTHDQAVQVEFDVPIPTIPSRSNLFDICRHSDIGREFVDHYETYRSYEARFRKNIKKALVGYYYKLYRGKLTEGIFEEMCALITNALPTESTNTWYQRRVQNTKPKGLLYMEYRYLQKKGYLNKPKNSAVKEVPTVPRKSFLESTAAAVDMSDDDDEQHLMQYAKLCLSSVKFSDKRDIMQHWVNCFKLRRREAIEGTLKLTDYAVLLNVTNITDLVNYDFRRIHPDCAELVSRMPVFMSKFKQIVKERRMNIDKERNLGAVLNDVYLHSFVVDDISTCYAFMTLPLILRPQIIMESNTKTKPTLNEIRECFIMMLETEDMLEAAVEARRQAATLKKQPARPFIVAIGTYAEISSYYVIFDRLRWNMETVTSAVDLFFKMHSVFHVEYDIRIGMVMKFLQLYLYDIRYDGQVIESAVEMLISDCNRY